MRATDPVVTFLLVLAIGVAAGILFDRLAGPSWLARQFSGSARGIVTSALVGVCRRIRRLSHRCACARRHGFARDRLPRQIWNRDSADDHFGRRQYHRHGATARLAE